MKLVSPSQFQKTWSWQGFFGKLVTISLFFVNVSAWPQTQFFLASIGFDATWIIVADAVLINWYASWYINSLFDCMCFIFSPFCVVLKRIARYLFSVMCVTCIRHVLIWYRHRYDQFSKFIIDTQKSISRLKDVCDDVTFHMLTNTDHTEKQIFVHGVLINIPKRVVEYILGSSSPSSTIAPQSPSTLSLPVSSPKIIDEFNHSIDTKLISTYHHISSSSYSGMMLPFRQDALNLNKHLKGVYSTIRNEIVANIPSSVLHDILETKADMQFYNAIDEFTEKYRSTRNIIVHDIIHPFRRVGHAYHHDRCLFEEISRFQFVDAMFVFLTLMCLFITRKFTR